LRAVIANFRGALQFEVGIQTFNPGSARSSAAANYERLADNFRFLRQETGVHIHADLIIGLPGETVQVLPPVLTGSSRSTAGDSGRHPQAPARHALIRHAGLADDLQRAPAYDICRTG